MNACKTFSLKYTDHFETKEKHVWWKLNIIKCVPIDKIELIKTIVNHVSVLDTPCILLVYKL